MSMKTVEVIKAASAMQHKLDTQTELVLKLITHPEATDEQILNAVWCLRDQARQLIPLNKAMAKLNLVTRLSIHRGMQK